MSCYFHFSLLHSTFYFSLFLSNFLFYVSLLLFSSTFHFSSHCYAFSFSSSESLPLSTFTFDFTFYSDVFPSHTLLNLHYCALLQIFAASISRRASLCLDFEVTNIDDPPLGAFYVKIGSQLFFTLLTQIYVPGDSTQTAISFYILL